jgi:hypothetical protein
MNEVTVNKNLVACCGLYCGACGARLKGRCPGCHDNVRAKWCKIRACCGEHAYATCASCTDFTDPNDCRRFNNLIARVFGVVMNSNRQACVLKIRALGLDDYATFMAGRRRQTLSRRGS